MTYAVKYVYLNIFEYKKNQNLKEYILKIEFIMIHVNHPVPTYIKIAFLIPRNYIKIVIRR